MTRWLPAQGAHLTLSVQHRSSVTVPGGRDLQPSQPQVPLIPGIPEPRCLSQAPGRLSLPRLGGTAPLGLSDLLSFTPWKSVSKHSDLICQRGVQAGIYFVLFWVN